MLLARILTEAGVFQLVPGGVEVRISHVGIRGAGSWPYRLGAFGSFTNSGQVCTAVGRHLVHEVLYHEYIAQLATTAEALTVGDGWRADVALGPLIDDAGLPASWTSSREVPPRVPA